MSISVTATVTFRHGTQLYTQGQLYSVADNLAHLFLKRNWVSGTTSGSKSVTMTADWREGTTRYLAGQSYLVPQPLADFLIEIGLATATASVSWNLGTFSFTRGVAGSINLNSHINNPGNIALTFGFETGQSAAAAVGITLASNGVLSYDGTDPGSDTTIPGVQFWADDNNVSAAVTTFGLTSTSTGTKPFCFGHVFKKGDIPSGKDIVSNIPEFQATITNRFSDGSAKYAILAGRAALTADVTTFIDLKAGTASAGSVLTESDLQALAPSASITLHPYGTVTLASLIGQTCTGKSTPGLFRTRISGPYMSEFHYYSPVGSDNHLAVWFYVRLFAGNHIEIETCVENGWLRVASPGVKTYTPTLTINGTTRNLGVTALDHYAQTRWAFPQWHGTDPVVTPRHNPAYLRSTGLVPNYGWTNPSNAAFSGLTSTIVPFQQGNWEVSQGAPGYSPEIGLLPKWEALYCTSGDPRAYTATVCNGYSQGRFSIHYRDEGTLRPIAFSSYPNLVISDNPGVVASGASTTNTYTPAISGGANGVFSTSHHPSHGYLPYLITGRWFFLEETQFCATLNFLKNTNSNRLFSQGVIQGPAGANQPRGAAWALRTLGQAVCMTPDGDTLQTELRNSYQFNLDYYHTNYVGSPNNLGIFFAGPNGYDAGLGHYTLAPWMDDFMTASLGWGIDMDLPLVAASKVKHVELMLWKCKAPVGRAGGQSPTEWCYRKAANYTMNIAPTEDFPTVASYNSAVYANWGDAYVVNFGTNSDCSSASTLLGGNIESSGFQQSYWGNYLPALSAAVNVAATGAAAAYQRVSTASNWAQYTAGFNDNPIWGIIPRV